MEVIHYENSDSKYACNKKLKVNRNKTVSNMDKVTCKNCLKVLGFKKIFDEKSVGFKKIFGEKAIAEKVKKECKKEKKKCCVRNKGVSRGFFKRYSKERCARAPYTDRCDHSDGLYLSTSYTMYSPNKKAPSSMKIEHLLRKNGYNGHYYDSRDDPHATHEWLCRPHFMEAEFGLIVVKCPFCNEEFAFDHSHFYTDDSYVKCPKCSCVVFGKEEVKDVPNDEIRRWWKEQGEHHHKIDCEKFIEWLDNMRKVVD